MAEKQEISPMEKKLNGIADKAIELPKKLGFEALELGLFDSIYKRSVARDEKTGEVTGTKKADVKGTATEMYRNAKKHLFMKVLGWSPEDFEAYESKWGNMKITAKGDKAVDQVAATNGLANQATLEEIVKLINDKGFKVESAKELVGKATEQYFGTQQGMVTSGAVPGNADEMKYMQKWIKDQTGQDVSKIVAPDKLNELYVNGLQPYAQRKAAQAAAAKNN